MTTNRHQIDRMILIFLYYPLKFIRNENEIFNGPTIDGEKIKRRRETMQKTMQVFFDRCVRWSHGDLLSSNFFKRHHFVTNRICHTFEVLQ